MHLPLLPQQVELINNIARHPTVGSKYHSSTLYSLPGTVDLSTLQASFRDVIARHAALRVTITSLDGDDVQLIRETDAAVRDSVRVIKARGGEVGRIIDQAMGSTYTLADIRAGRPLFTATIHQNSHRESLLHLRLHHLIYDGWSYRVLLQTIAHAYAARFEGRAPEWDEPPFDYRQYVMTAAGAKELAEAAAVTHYRAALNGATTPIQWSDDEDASQIADTHVRTVSAQLSPGELNTVAEVSKEQRVSPFFVLLCATALAISRSKALPAVLVGVDVMNRRGAAMDDAVGFFLNTRLIAIRCSHKIDLARTVRNHRAAWFAAAKHDATYYDVALGHLGITQYVKVNSPSMTARWDEESTLCLGEAAAQEIDVPNARSSWRDLTVEWIFLGSGGYEVLLHHRSSVIGSDRAAGILEELAAIMAKT